MAKQATIKKVGKPADQYIGSRIRMRRMMLHMSQEKLGDVLGLTFQQVQKYEKGTNRVGGSRILEISKALQVPPEFFFEGIPGGETKFTDSPSPSYVADFLATSDGLSIAKSFMKITPKLRRTIAELIERVSAE